MKFVYLLFSTIILVGCSKSPEIGSADQAGSDDGFAQNTSSNLSASANEIYQKVLEKQADIVEITSIFKISDEQVVSNTINALNRYDDNIEAVQLIHDIWKEKTEKYPKFAWAILRRPSIKVTLAATLFRFDKKNSGSYLEYIKGSIIDGDEQTKINALINLGMIGSNENIPIFKRYVLEGNVPIAGAAASALGILRTNESRAALTELSQLQEVDENKREVILQVLNSQVWK